MTISEPLPHLSHRSNWLRAAVLGANDGIVSTSSLILGVASAGASGSAIATAGTAGLVAGALSMAAGEYVSVSSQRDAEKADLVIEEIELSAHPAAELRELTEIYERRGLTLDLAEKVAVALTEADPLGAHARDELGFDAGRRARPLQAAWASALAFAAGAILPLLAVVVAPPASRIVVSVAVTLLALALTGYWGARLGGAPTLPGVARVLFWGSLAMAVTSGIGALVGGV